MSTFGLLMGLGVAVVFITGAAIGWFAYTAVTRLFDWFK